MSGVLKNRFKKICLIALAVIIVGLILYALIDSTYSSTVNQWLSLSSFSYGMMYSSPPSSISLWLSLDIIFSESADSTLSELNEILGFLYLMIGLGFGLVPGSYLQLLGFADMDDRQKKIVWVGSAVTTASLLMLVILLVFTHSSTEILIVLVLTWGFGFGLRLVSLLLFRAAQHNRNPKTSQ